MKKQKGPERINIEENSLGINFKKSEKIKNYFNKSSYPWKNDIVPGPLVDNVFIIYVNSKRYIHSTPFLNANFRLRWY